MRQTHKYYETDYETGRHVFFEIWADPPGRAKIRLIAQDALYGWEGFHQHCGRRWGSRNYMSHLLANAGTAGTANELAANALRTEAPDDPSTTVLSEMQFP